MATQTENLGLSKPAYSEPTDIGVINSNMDILDGAIGGSDMGTEAETITGAIAEHSEAIGNVETDVSTIGSTVSSIKSDIGIVEDGDTATHAISSGQYVIWKNELYKATAAIPIGTALSSTNLEAVDNGIGGDVSTLTDHIGNLFKRYSFSGTPDSDGCIISDCPLSTYIPFQTYMLGREGWVYSLVQNNNKSTSYWVVKITGADASSGTFSGYIVAIKKADIAT